LICSEELGSRHQTPTLIGCRFLTNLQDLPARPFEPNLLFLPPPLRSAKPSIMTDFLKLCPAVFAVPSAIRAFAASRWRLQRSPRFYTVFESVIEARAPVSPAAALPLSRRRLEQSPRL
jgi:hypothetical protein